MPVAWIVDDDEEMSEAIQLMLQLISQTKPMVYQYAVLIQQHNVLY